MENYNDLIITEAEDIKENIVNEYSNDESLEKTEINQDISEQLFYLNSYYNKLVSFIKRDYSDFKNKKYFNKFYCINSKWMSNFLKLYKYKQINTLIGEFGINSEEEFFQKVKEKQISLDPNNYIEKKESINLGNFDPEKNIITKYTFNRYKRGELAIYFDDFALVNKDFYDKIKQNDKNKNEVDICLVDDIFIYKINENVLGIGIPEIKEEILPIFKIQFFIIITEKFIYIDNDEKIIFNSDSEVNEIFKCEDLEKYLILKREVNFEEQDKLKRIDMKFNKNKIGFIYNITDFNIEKYWRRTEEKYNKTMILKKTLKEPEIKAIEEREKRNNDLKKIREIEKRQDAMFKRTMMQRSLNEQLRNQQKNQIIKNVSKNYLLQKEKEKLKQIKCNNKIFIFKPMQNNIGNSRYQENNDLQNQNNGMNNNKNLEKNFISKDKFPSIPKAFEPIILPIIPEKRRSLQIPKNKEFYLTYNNNKNKRNVTQEKNPFELYNNEKPVKNRLFSSLITNNKYKTNYKFNFNFNNIILSYNEFSKNLLNRKKFFLKCDNKENKNEKIKEDIMKDKKEDIKEDLKERTEKYENVEEEKKKKEKENEEDEEGDEEVDEEEEDDDEEEDEEDDEEEEDDDEENEEDEEDEEDEESEEEDEKKEDEKEDEKEEKIKDNKKNKKEDTEEKKTKHKKGDKNEDKKKKKKKNIILTKEEKKFLKKLRKKMKKRFKIIKKLKEIKNERLLRYYRKLKKHRKKVLKRKKKMDIRDSKFKEKKLVIKHPELKNIYNK